MSSSPNQSKPPRRWVRSGVVFAVLAIAGFSAWLAWPQLFAGKDPIATYQFATVQRGAATAWLDSWYAERVYSVLTEQAQSITPVR